MADLIDFLPIFQETAATIRARLDADANAGLALDDPERLDVREGTFYWDVTQPLVLEFSRLWDALSTDVPAAAFATFAWGEYLDAHGALFGLERKDAVAALGSVTFTGPVGTVIATGTLVATDEPTADVPSVSFITTDSGTITGTPGTTSTVVIPVAAVEAGADGNVAIGAVTSIESATAATAVTNAAAMTGGADEESDEALRERIMLEFSGRGAGNIADYQRWALEIDGVGRVYVNPVWQGGGTVQVVVMLPSGQPVSGTVVTAVQDYLDPASGAGGKAPPGVVVTVQTSVAVSVTVTATITFQAGYSLDGAGGTVATRAAILNALDEYLVALDVGDDVIYNHVLAQFFRVPGVLNVSGLQINGGTADVAIASSPAQIAVRGTTTLS
jgi:uncharacterized phage protein gp47/JayE